MDPDQHKILTRQINKILGDSPQLTPELIQLLKRVSDTYEQFDDDHKLIERSLEISSNEMMAINKNIEATVEQRTEELRQEHIRFTASINSFSLGFIMCDIAGKVIMMNPKVLEIFQAVPQGQSQPAAPIKKVNEWTFQEIDALFEGIDLTKGLQTAVGARRAIEFAEVTYRNKALRLLMSPIINDMSTEHTNLGTVLVLEDITEAKVMSRSKDEFFSIASHELRTPLTAIMGNASMIIDYHADLLKDPDIKEMVYDIHDASERLIGIVGDFIDVSGLEQDKVMFKPEEFSLEPLVETVAYEMRTVLEQKNLSLQVEPKTLGTLPHIWADKGRTKQVLYNLVSNALKFTEKGGASIRISAVGETMKIMISDTGHGISEENQKLLFHKLQQAGDSLLTRDTTRGTGLGLYICKILVERMGGTIELESSEPNKGSTFSVTLPLATASRKQAPMAATALTDTTTGL